MKCCMLPQAVDLLQLMLNLDGMIRVEMKEHYAGDFIQYASNIGVRSNANEPNCLKLDVMIDVTKLYSFIGS